MIKFTSDNKDIVKCWAEAFGDSENDILFFINNVQNANCLAYYVGGNIASMLYLVESSLGKYIYAACTLKEYRKNGYMGELLDYCKKNYNNISLIPANKGLIKYYNNRGLTITDSVDNLHFNECDEIVEYLFDGCELKQPIVLKFERK